MTPILNSIVDALAETDALHMGADYDVLAKAALRTVLESPAMRRVREIAGYYSGDGHLANEAIALLDAMEKVV